MPQYHWGVGWAQMMQESAGRADAVSPVGAVGLAQFMPGTWGDMIRAGIVPPGTPRRDARHSLQAQAYYMRQLTRIWKSRRTNGDRIRLALASYNGGAGDLIEAQKLCGGPVEYDAIMKCLHMVENKSVANVHENKSYVPHIERHYRKRFGHDMD